MAALSTLSLSPDEIANEELSPASLAAAVQMVEDSGYVVLLGVMSREWCSAERLHTRRRITPVASTHQHREHSVRHRHSAPAPGLQFGRGARKLPLLDLHGTSLIVVSEAQAIWRRWCSSSSAA